MTTKYQHHLTGVATTAEDPERDVWYSVSCTFWTDEWDKLGASAFYQIPVCPNCGSMGYNGPAQEFEVSPKFEREHPGYTAKLNECKNKTPCQLRSKWMEQFK